jgi:hypothetical protein
MLGHLSASLALGAINSSTAAREAGRLLRLRPPVQLQPETLLELGQVSGRILLCCGPTMVQPFIVKMTLD